MTQLQANAERIERDINALAQFTDKNESGHTRIFFSEEYKQATAHMAHLMQTEAELTVKRDTAGNLIGRMEGQKKECSTIMVGSHLDTVRGGGRFDGIAGVVAGLEVARVLKETGQHLDHALEIVAFLAEEPSPFGLSTTGSRAMAGKLSESMLTTATDPSGRTLGQAIDAMGGDYKRIYAAKRRPEELFAYLEMHIEQGPLLDQKQIPIGVVSGIVGITRGSIKIAGEMDHAGTTPMATRKDALAAAAEMILALEDLCREHDHLVGTVGQLEVFPNSANVVPGRVSLGFEIRSLDTELNAWIIECFEREIGTIENKRKVAIEPKIWVSSPSVQFDPKMITLAVDVCNRLGVGYVEMPSGAGHDANHMAELTRAGMIFVPSKGGRSHCPEEWTEFADLSLGTSVLGNMITSLDKSV